MKKKQAWPDRIKALIERYGGPLQLAVELDVSYSSVLRWRDGKGKPSQLAEHRIEGIEQKEEAR